VERRPESEPRAAVPIGMIPHSRPALGAREARAVAAVISSGHIAQGPEVAALEATAALAVGLADDAAEAAHHAVALSSGTAALLLALRALRVDRGDEVLIPAYACASLNQAVLYAGATPRPFDCDPTSLNPDPDDARRRAGARAAACIVPHLFGRPADIEAFRALDLPIIEDCAQTLGVRRADRPVGSFGDITVCSFYATKLIAGGEGGMLLARDRALAARARTLRDCEDPAGEAASFNFKMSDLHAAVAAVQLRRLPEFLARRAALATAYREALRDSPVRLPADDIEQAWFRFVVMLGEEGDLDALLRRCEAVGVACRRPVGRLVAAVDLDDLPGCRAAWRRACSLPLYPALSDDEARLVPQRFRAALDGAGE
jgi:dTDP-4-amino-4,6-dideoxygalactose transaminase